MKTYLTAKAAIMDADGNFLVLRRSGSHPTMAHHMDLPGGIIEKGEQPAACLVREIDEETHLKLGQNDLRLFFAMTESYHDSNAVRQVFLVRLPTVKPEIKLSWEHDQYEWLPIEQAISSLEAGRYTKKGLEHLKSNDLLEDL